LAFLRGGVGKNGVFCVVFCGEFVVMCGINVVLITTYFTQRKNATFLKYFCGNSFEANEILRGA
jgi:hypothetical protein